MTKLTEERIMQLYDQAVPGSVGWVLVFARAIEAELQPTYTGTCGPLHSFDGEVLTPAEVQERLKSVQEPVGEVVGYWNAGLYAELPLGTKLYTAQPDQTTKLDLIAANEACDNLNELCREQQERIATLEAALREVSNLANHYDNMEIANVANVALATISAALGEE